MSHESILAEVRSLAAEKARTNAAEFNKLHQRAESGDVSAMYEVGYALDFGEGVPVDMNRASVWYAKAAARSSFKAMNNLGYSYERQGNHVEAQRWYQKAAGAGDALAMKNLGWQFLEGVGGPKDLAAARRWLERAEDLGFVGANRPLAMLLREEDPVGNAFRCAQLLREVAEEGGDSGDLYEWAQCLLSGSGVVADTLLAERWMCSAASDGDEDAQGWLKEHGKRWVSEWTWVPQVSLGPLRFGESPDHLTDALGLEVDDFDGDFGAGPLWEDILESRPLHSKLYGLTLSREYGLLTDVWSGVESHLVIQYKGVNLLGASLEGALALLDANDWKAEAGTLSDVDVLSESLGVELEILDERVRRLTLSAAWDSDEEFRIGSGGRPTG